MEEETKATQVRFPAHMYNRLMEMAKKSHRSLNAEIIFSLEEYFRMTSEMVTFRARVEENQLEVFLEAAKKFGFRPELVGIERGTKLSNPNPPENPSPPSTEPPQGSA